MPGKWPDCLAPSPGTLLPGTQPWHVTAWHPALARYCLARCPGTWPEVWPPECAVPRESRPSHVPYNVSPAPPTLGFWPPALLTNPLDAAFDRYHHTDMEFVTDARMLSVLLDPIGSLDIGKMSGCMYVSNVTPDQARSTQTNLDQPGST